MLVAVPRQPAARNKVLDAYAALLVESGERAATLDAVAKRAAVSKGGLLYHFASKAALADGLADRLDDLVAVDVVAMKDAPEGAVSYLLRTSYQIDREFELIYLATARLAMGDHQRAREAIDAAYAAWTSILLEQGASEAAATVIMLMADGLSLRSSVVDVPGGAAVGLGVVGIDEVISVGRAIASGQQ